MHTCPTCGRPFDPIAQATEPCAPVQRPYYGHGSHARGMERLKTDMGGNENRPLAAIGPGGIDHPDTKQIHE